MVKVYRGKRVAPLECVVTVDGEPLEHHVRHSDGFEWGYGGSGPADLALAILWDCFGELVAREWYQRFKWAVVAHFRHQGWELTELQIAERCMRSRPRLLPTQPQF